MKRFKVYTREKGIVETDKYHSIKYLTWYREDGPAIIGYYDNGLVNFEEYWVNGGRHRLGGPACIYYNEIGHIFLEEYWINGIEYSKDNYHKELLKLKVQSL